MEVDLTHIIQAFIALAAAVITSVVIPFIKRKNTNEKQLEMDTWINVAVAAAEQLYKGHGRGDEKKKYVMDFLEGKGYKFDIDTVIESIETSIEASVYELKKP